jgi:hypothetical protein
MTISDFLPFESSWLKRLLSSVAIHWRKLLFSLIPIHRTPGSVIHFRLTCAPTIGDSADRDNHPGIWDIKIF